jgi:hypothetical protein
MDKYKPLSDFIASLFRERFPAAADDPAMTALITGLFLGSVITWFVYWLVHRGRINGLQARNGILEERLKFKDEESKSKDQEIERLKRSPTSLTSRAEEQDKSPLEVKPFFRKEPSNPCISVVGIDVKNNSRKHLSHCFVRVETIENSDPSAFCGIFSDSQIRKSPPSESLFQLVALDNRNVSIVQFDSVNGMHLGIELLCFSTQGFVGLDPNQWYKLIIVSGCEIGPPIKRVYKLWVDGQNFLNKKLCFDELPA